MKSLLYKMQVIIQLSLEDYRKKFISSTFGFLWSFIQPIVTTLVLWIVFSVGFRASNVKDVPYVCWLLSGLVPWYFFSESISSATNSLLEYRFILKQMSFPSHVIPIVKVISSIITNLIFSLILVIILNLNGLVFNIFWFQIIYYFICLLIYIIGLSWMISSIRPFFPDIGELVNVMLQMGMWFTPILWDVNIIDPDLIDLFKLNPLFYIAQGYRDSLIYKVPISARLDDTFYFWAISVITLFIGYQIFKKLKHHFNDVI